MVFESGFEETSKDLHTKNCPSSIVEKDGYFLLSNLLGTSAFSMGGIYKSGIGRSIKRITEHIVSSLTLDAESGRSG